MNSTNLIIRSLFVCALLLLTSSIHIPQGYAYSGILYPAQGDVYTEIYLQVRGTAGTGTLHLFWDDIFLGTYPESSLGYDVFFYPPNQHPYCDLGNHTVFIEIWFSYWDGSWYYVYWNHSMTFEIIEKQPCEDWLTLNATYTALLSDYTEQVSNYLDLFSAYTNLNMSYYALLEEFDQVSLDYASLLTNFEALSSTYNGMQTNYDLLSSTYNSLLVSYSNMQVSYGDLSGDYESLLASYSNMDGNYENLEQEYDSLDAAYSNLQSSFLGLQTTHNSLSTSFTDLETDYHTLQSNNSNLTNNYDALIMELEAARLLNYVVLAALMVFIATTVYLAFVKTRKRQTLQEQP